MLFPLMLSGMLAAAPQAVSANVATHADAAELARSGRNEEALEVLQKLAAANPRDREARVAIARLHVAMGYPDLAESVFRSVVLEDRSNVDAAVGLGSALTLLGRTEEALEILDDAEEAAPENPELLAALGRAHYHAGHTARSLEYLQRAVAAAPTSENRALLEQTRKAFAHRVESTSFLESFSIPVSGTRAADLTLNARLNDRFRLLGRGQVQRKFGSTEQRGGLGLEWRWRPETTFTGHAFAGPGNDVLPEIDGSLGVAHLYGSAEWGLGARYIRVAGADVSVVSPSVTWQQTDRLTLGLRYHLSITSFELGLDRQVTQSGGVNGAYLMVPRVWVHGGYARGIESFDTLSPDRIGDFDANTASGGLRLDLRTLTSLVGVYEYQWRSNSTEMDRLSLSIVQRF